MTWLLGLWLGLALGLIAGAFVWLPIGIRETDRRWRARMAQAAEWRQRYPTEELPPAEEAP